MIRYDLDQNASTTLDERVRQAMLPALELGNPSSSHALGRAARTALDEARRRVASLLGCEAGEVVFTASGSESNALALQGAFLARIHAQPATSKRVLLSAIEHPSLLEQAKLLAKLGAEIVTVPVDEHGVLKLDALSSELERGAALVALMWVNNETGVIQPVREAAELSRKAGALFLCDAVQAAGKHPLDHPLAWADLVSLSAHKFHGPHGAGTLLVRRGLQLEPLIGGHQERGRRGGTENVASAVGLSKALELAVEGITSYQAHTRALRDRFEQGVRQRWPTARIHGEHAMRVSNTSSIGFARADGEALLIGLDLGGVCASLGAACASGTLAPSHVLLAMGLSPSEAKSSLRFSFGRDTPPEAIDRTFSILEELLTRPG